MIITIISILKDLNYSVVWKVLNAKDYGIPQNRNRWYCVGIDKKIYGEINEEIIFPEKVELINNKKSPIQDEYIEKYLNKYQGIHEFMNNIVKEATENGYVSTSFNIVGLNDDLPNIAVKLPALAVEI